MKKCEWQRARSDEQREQRITEILNAAEKLFRSLPYEKVTMQKIAKEAYFTQSNLYRYFTTKEEIFLTLHTLDLDKWAQDLKIKLSSVEMPLAPEKFISIWTDVLSEQKRFLELSPLLAVTLEKNTSEKVYREIKVNYKEKMDQAVVMIQSVLPSMTEEKILDFLITHQGLLAGILPMTQLSEMQIKVLHELDLDLIRLNFKPFYKKTLLIYLKGLLG